MRYTTPVLVLVLLSLLTFAGYQGYQANLKDAQIASYKQGVADGKIQATPKALPDVQKFAQAFCDNDSEAVVPFVPPSYLEGFQKGLAAAKARGDVCASIRYLGGYEQDGEQQEIYLMNDGHKTEYWVFTWKNGVVTDIN